MEENETATKDDKKEEFLYKILDKEEYSSLNENIRVKIENAVQEKVSAFLVKEALLQVSNADQDKVIENLRIELNTKSSEIEALQVKLDAATSEIDTLKNQLLAAETEALKVADACKKLQYEWQDFKTQRDLACDEKESLLTMIERRNSELAMLREEKADLNNKLEAAVKSKMAAMENSQEVESLRISLEYKEKRMEQEASLLRSQVQSLNEELEEKMVELLNLRRSISSQSVSNESELASKTEELRIALETISDLRESNERLSSRAEELLEKLSFQRDSYDVMMQNFHQELTAQKKLAQLYKDMCSENDTKTEKLTSSIQELKQLLNEATNRYGDLETKQKEKILKLEDEISVRDECIQHLKKELKDANDLLDASKQESVDAAIGSISPCAAAASRLLKSGMTLTQIYTQYARVSEELQLEKEENRRLNLYVATIVNEIEEKAPILQQQRIDYEKSVAAVESLTQEMDRMIAESQVLSQECAEARKTSLHLTRENQRLKKELEDLARQVCYLVKAVEEARGGLVSHDTAYEAVSGPGGSAQDVISKHLVTFSSIQDLQENNQKLLALVRQLSEKQEAVESVSTQEYHDLQIKKEKLEQRVVELIEEMNRQSKMLDLIRSQSATYKKLYQQAMGNEAEASATPGTPLRTSPNLVTSTPLPVENSQVDEEKNKKLLEANETIKTLEEQLAKLKGSSKAKEQELNEKVDKLDSEVREWMFKNSKLVAQAEYNGEKSKVLEANLKTTKKQVQALEERNRTVSEICAKHEQSLVIFKDQAMEAHSKLARAEVQRDNLQQEVLLLKTAEARLTKEREALNRERISNSLLMNNLEGLKAALDRSEAEGKLRLEVQLSEALKECSALRSSLRDEKEKFKELANSLERQTALAKERMLEEKSLADKARADLEQVKAELEVKTQAVTELNERIRELGNQPVRSVIQTVSSNLDESAKRVKELEKQVSELERESARLHIQLEGSQSSSKQYMEVAEAAETQLQNLLQEHHSCAQVLADKEKEWAAKVQSVESKLAEALKERNRLTAENESRKQSSASDVQEISTTLTSVQTQLQNRQQELENVRKELVATTKELDAAREDINRIKREAEESEARYSQEVVLHSQAIQSLDAVRKQMLAVSETESKLRQERDDALAAISTKTSAWEEQKKQTEKELEALQGQLKDLDEQNRVLHDTLQKVSNQMSVVQAKVSVPGESSTDVNTSLNTSTELSNQAQEELLKVIKFLRQEKDLATTRNEMLQAESMRLRAQVALLQKQLDETNSALKELKESTDVSEKTSAKHAELLRKVESLNAVTDSNRLLREERNRYKTESARLSEKLSQTESTIAPLRAEIKQLKEKVETLTTENENVSAEVIRWKTRAAQLSERTKTSPEEWRRLTNERENLAKQWQNEKVNNEKLEEALKKSRTENSTLNEQLIETKKQLQNESSEVRRLNEELNTTKQKLRQLDQELATVKGQVKKLTEDIAKATEETNAKEATIADLTAKELHIKKIAKRYKIQFEELAKTTDEEKKKREEEEAKKAEAQKPAAITEEEQERLRAEGRSQVISQMTELEGRMADRVKELQDQVTAAVEEAETLKKDNEALKTSINEKEERAKLVIKNARTKIALLTEQKSSLEQELSQSRGHADQTRDESDSKLNALKAMVARLEKERAEQAELANQERERMANQMKVLNQRITQMQRSLPKPFHPAPSTSSQSVHKTTMEPPTANIKPMAGSSTARKQKQTPAQQLVGPYWSGGNETPFASIRPVQTRTMAVQPTSLGGGTAPASAASGSSGSAALMVPLQQQVHTTGTSGEALSSSPTSSHTDYMPATSSATPIRVVVAPVPLNAQSTQEVEECILENESSGPPQQTVAMVTPRVEAAAGSPMPGPSSTSSQASSSNTVTTTQAGLKRPRDVEGDSSTGVESEHAKSSPQLKRTRVSGSGQSEVFQHHVTHSEGSEVEYQVPTSSQRDQEDDLVIMLVSEDSEDEGIADEGDVEEPDDGFEEDNGEGYEVESYSRDGQDMVNYEEGPDIDEENAADGGSNEVEIIEDSNEVPVAVPTGQEQQQQSSEATSSGNDNNTDHVVVSHAASSQSFRTRSVPPLNRAQPSLQGYDEGGDDSIVPSTPTLFLPRRGDGFGEAVSSPQVPHQRFTFSEPSPTSRRDEGTGDDPGTGRSVPTTPLVASPQEVCQDQAEPSVAISVPNIPINTAEGEMPPPDPSVAPADDDLRGQDEVLIETVTVEEDNDGVTSEGEKPPAIGGEIMEEGREAEASEPIVRTGGTARRSGRLTYPRRGPSRRPTPIVWNEPGSSGLPTHIMRATARGTPRGRASRRNWQ